MERILVGVDGSARSLKAAGPITATQPSEIPLTDIRVTHSRAMDTQATRDIPAIPVPRAMDTQATQHSPVTPDPQPTDTRADRCRPFRS